MVPAPATTVPVSLSWPDPLPAAGAVRLRPYRTDDLPLVAELAADPYLPTVGSLPVPYSDTAGLAYLARQHDRLTDGTGYSFAVVDIATDRGVGSAGLWLTPGGSGRATAGYGMAASARRRGFATDALTALTAFGWTLPQLHRIELFIEPWNTGSVRTAERCGYQREGLLRSHQPVAGLRRDMLLYAALRPDPAAGTTAGRAGPR